LKDGVRARGSGNRTEFGGSVLTAESQKFGFEIGIFWLGLGLNWLPFGLKLASKKSHVVDSIEDNWVCLVNSRFFGKKKLLV
jgi:hypothetical protein